MYWLRDATYQISSRYDQRIGYKVWCLYKDGVKLYEFKVVSEISSQYLATALQPNNASHNMNNNMKSLPITSGSRNMNQIRQSRSLHHVILYLSSGILHPTDYGTTIKSLHSRAVTISKSLYLITTSFRLLPCKLLRKKQIFLGPTEVPIHNFVFFFCCSFFL